jgi:uncharacterized protein (DUF1810 family)
MPDAPHDPFDLDRFVEAQAFVYDSALSEIERGRKRTHWMWYIFPQLEGLGSSATSRHYSIKSLEEARAYLQHPVLGARLLACANAVVELEGRSMSDVFGTPDDLKLRSCATLFAFVSPPGSVFERILDKHYRSRRDERTLELLAALAAADRRRRPDSQ